MAAPKTGPTAKKNPEDRLGHPRSAGGHEQSQTIEIDEAQVEVLAAVFENHGLTPAEHWHPVALYSWNAFCSSPTRVNFESTDYAQAWITCELIHQSLSDGMSAGKSMQLRMYLNDLGFTEGARRAIGIEIKKTTEAADPKKVIAIGRMQERKNATG